MHQTSLATFARSASGLAMLLAPIVLLALTATADAQTAPGPYGVAKDRGFTITPPFQRSKSYTMSCGYGCYKHTNGGTQDHFALDFLMSTGEPVHPIAAGKVRIAKTVLGSGHSGFEPYGRFVLIEHFNGYYSMYAHLDSVSVAVGAWVDVDVPIGTAGKTGSGAGNTSHLHFALYKNLTYINATDASYSGGTAVVPEPFAGCTKSAGGDCEYLGNYTVFRRDDFAPEVIVRAGGMLDLFTCNRSQRNLMYRRRESYGTWAPIWTNLEGTCASSPTATHDGWGNAFVFVRGLDARLWVKTRTGSGWSGWYSIGDSVIGRPAAALDTASGLVRVFARRSPDQAMYVASQLSPGSTSFTGWQRLGGYLVNSPVAGTRADGRVDAYAVGLDYRLYKLPDNGNGTFTLENWHPQNVSIEGEPALVAQGAPQWAARSTGDTLLLQNASVPVAATHRPGVARNQNGNVYLFERRRSSSAADYVYPSGGSWYTGSFGGLVTSELAAVRATADHVMMFTWGTGGLYHREQTAPNTVSWYDWYDLQIPQ